MINTVLNYKKYKASLPQIISESDYKTQYFIKLLNLKKPTYYRKLKENSFSIEEIEKITRSLYPVETLLYEMEQSEQDIDNGNFIKHGDLTKKLRKEFL